MTCYSGLPMPCKLFGYDLTRWSQDSICHLCRRWSLQGIYGDMWGESRCLLWEEESWRK